MSKSFIDTYVDTMFQRGAAIEDYHRLIAICAVSAVLSRDVNIRMRHGFYFSNIWGIIVGESSYTYKTTSINMIRNSSILPIARKEIIKGNRKKAPGIHLGPSDGSPEGLIKELEKHPSMFLIRDEISRLWIEASSRKFQSGIEVLYADFYDCPEYRLKSLADKDIELRNIYMVLLAGTTPTGIKCLNPKSLTEGYVPRHLFSVCREKRPLLPIEFLTKEDEEKERMLKKELLDIHKFFHEDTSMEITNKGKEDYNSWQRDIEEYEAKESSIMWSFYSRYRAYVIKLGIIFAAARFSHEVEVEDIEQGINYIETKIEHARDIVDMVQAQSSNTKYSDDVQKVMDKIQTYSPISLRDMQQKLHKQVSRNDIVKIASELGGAGFITIEYGPRGSPIYTEVKNMRKKRIGL